MNASMQPALSPATACLDIGWIFAVGVVWFYRLACSAPVAITFEARRKRPRRIAMHLNQHVAQGVGFDFILPGRTFYETCDTER